MPRRLLDSLRSLMMWSIARRCSSRFWRRCSSSRTCARSRASAVAAAAPDPVTAGGRFSEMLCDITQLLPAGRVSGAQLLPHAFQLLLERDHLQLPADDDFLE